MKKLWSSLCLVLLLSAGCAQHDAVRHPSLAYDLTAQQNKLVQGNLEFMARPIHSRTELETYFGTDLLRHGVLPVQMVVANKSGETVNFTTEGLALYDPSGGRHPFLPADKVVDKSKRSHWRTAGWGVAFGILGAVPSAMNVERVNRQIRADFEARSIKGGNLVDGGITEGTAFFQVPEGLSSLDGYALAFVYRRAGAAEPLTIRYNLQGQVEQRQETTARDDEDG